MADAPRRDQPTVELPELLRGEVPAASDGPVTIPPIHRASTTGQVPTDLQPPTQAIPSTPAPTATLPVTDAPAGSVRPSPPRPIPGLRRTVRVIRQIDTWSVFKVALLFSFFLYVVCLTSGALLWRVAQNTGTVDNVERFFENFGWLTFELNGGAIYHQAWVVGLFGVLGLTGLAVLMATVFNLITDLVGGVRIVVVEEEFPRPTKSRLRGLFKVRR